MFYSQNARFQTGRQTSGTQIELKLEMEAPTQVRRVQPRVSVCAYRRAGLAESAKIGHDKFKSFLVSGHHTWQGGQLRGNALAL